MNWSSAPIYENLVQRKKSRVGCKFDIGVKINCTDDVQSIRSSYGIGQARDYADLIV